MTFATSADTLEESSQGKRLLASFPYLFVVLECDDPHAGAARHSLADIDEVIVGRGSTRSATRRVEGKVRRLLLRVPGSRMSSTHLRLFVHEGRWMLEDAGSTNGTHIGGDRVARAVLQDGSVFDAGRTLFLFRAALPTPAGTTLDERRAGADGDRLPTLLPAAASTHAALARVARSPVSVLLSGETGTGKEVTARAIHEMSGRAGRFVAVNCGALPAPLAEAQFFGHVRGAFSGAVRDEAGFVRAAGAGTLFLDEIGDLAFSSQAALLRVLQEQEVVPVGGTRPVKVDFRVVAATHHDLDKLTVRESFRADLLARLRGYDHALLPLRARREDFGLLVAALLLKPGREISSLAIEAGRALITYAWPANIRELEQCLARAAALCKDGAVMLEDLPDAVRTAKGSVAPALTEEDARLREALVAELTLHHGNIAHVAKAMRKARMQIQRWIKRFDLDPDAYRRPR